MKIRNAKSDPFFIVWTKINDDVFGLMILQSNSKPGAERGFAEMATAYANQHPGCTLSLLRMEPMESAEQVERAKEQLKADHPKQLFADEAFPDNPNAALFQPASQWGQLEDQTDEALIRYLCDGGITS